MRNVETRIVYLIMFLAVLVPLLAGTPLTPSKLISSDRTFDVLESLNPEPGKIALFYFDFGPNTKAENEPQTEVLIEHLFRKRIPVVLISQYQLSDAFLSGLPEKIAARLRKESAGEKWEYGADWINVGFKPGGALYMQTLAKSQNIPELFAKDVKGTPISSFPRFAATKGLEDVSLVLQTTGLVGVLDNLIQFLQKDNVRPKLVHACTSITIPEAYIFLDSGQIAGLLEGVAGAARYGAKLQEKYPESKNEALFKRNTALGVTHLVLLGLIVAGNIVGFFASSRKKGERTDAR